MKTIPLKIQSPNKDKTDFIDVTVSTRQERMLRDFIVRFHKMFPRAEKVNESLRVCIYQYSSTSFEPSDALTDTTGNIVNIKINKIQKPEPIRTQLPDDDIVAAFLHYMRPFLVGCESTFTPKIFDFFESQNSNLLTARIGSMRDFYDNYPASMNMFFDGDCLTDYKGLNIWLNAEEYHQDFDKSEKVSLWKEIAGEEKLKSIHLLALLKRVNIMNDLINYYIKPIVDGLNVMSDEEHNDDSWLRSTTTR